MNADHLNKMAHGPVNLTIESTTADIAKLLRSGRSEQEIEAIVWQVNDQGKRLYGYPFKLRIDPTSLTSDIVARAFITIPGR